VSSTQKSSFWTTSTQENFTYTQQDSVYILVLL